MRILYSSSHSVLEWDELSLLTDLKTEFPVEVFSMGAFSNPNQVGDGLRTVIPKGKFYPDLYGVAMQCSNDLLHDELIDWCDIWICMHNSSVPGQKFQQRWIANNLDRFLAKKKKVIFRSIGQTTPAIEEELKGYRAKGMKIMRYSPMESKIPNFAGEDAMIRFAKDENDFKGWTGEKQQVITIAQSFTKRGDHLRYDLFDKITGGFNRKVFGTENADLGELWGGSPSYEVLKSELRSARVYYYFGTIPAFYTLGFMEALLTGIPIVAVGSNLRQHNAYSWPNYEVPDIIQNGINGYVSDDINDLRGYIQLLLESPETARRVGDAGRRTAIDLFGLETRKLEWVNFLKSI